MGEVIIKKPDCGMKFNCEVVNFDSKLMRLWHKLEFVEKHLKDKLLEEDLSYITQLKYEAEDLTLQFHREYEVKRES